MLPSDFQASRDRLAATFKRVATFIVIIVIIFAAASCFVTIRNTIGNSRRSTATRALSYSMGADSIPSVASVLGERQAQTAQTSRSGSWPFPLVERNYVYTSTRSLDDMTQYMRYLQENDYVLSADERTPDMDKTVRLAALSKDDGYIVVIRLSCRPGSFSVDIWKGERDLTGYTGIWGID